MGNAGRVLMIPKGEYNAATTYEMLDFVYYNGRSYVCKQTSTGNVPTNTTYWQALTGDASAEIQALTNYVTENNVKNILPVSLSALKALNSGGTWVDNVCSLGGVDFTVNSDFSILLNGTSTGVVAFTLFNGTNPTDYNGKILSGFSGGSGGTGIRISDAIATSVYNYSGDTEITGLTATNQVNVVIRLESGKTFNNQLVKPMIREASITEPTYQPYAKTNVELTQALGDYKTGSFTKASSDIIDRLSIKQFGKVITVNGYIEGVTASANSQFTLGTISGVDVPPVAIRTIAGVASAGYNPPEQIGYLSLSTGNSLAITVTEAITSKVLYFSFSYTI